MKSLRAAEIQARLTWSLLRHAAPRRTLYGGREIPELLVEQMDVHLARAGMTRAEIGVDDATVLEILRQDRLSLARLFWERACRPAEEPSVDGWIAKMEQALEGTGMTAELLGADPQRVERMKRDSVIAHARRCWREARDTTGWGVTKALAAMDDALAGIDADSGVVPVTAQEVAALLHAHAREEAYAAWGNAILYAREERVIPSWNRPVGLMEGQYVLRYVREMDAALARMPAGRAEIGVQDADVRAILRLAFVTQAESHWMTQWEYDWPEAKRYGFLELLDRVLSACQLGRSSIGLDCHLEREICRDAALLGAALCWKKASGSGFYAKLLVEQMDGLLSQAGASREDIGVTADQLRAVLQPPSSATQRARKHRGKS